MIGNVAFYSMRGSLSTAEYPLVSGSETPAHTVQNVAYQVGLQTEIHVPKFSGYDTVNVAKIDGQYYWITSFYERTNANGQIFFKLSYMAPTSMFERGDSMTAYLNRSPTYLTKYLSDDWTKGDLTITNYRNVGVDMITYHGDPMYWVQITGVDTDGNYHRYGCFATAYPLGRYSDPVIKWSVLAPNGTYPSIAEIMGDISEITPFTASSIKDISISRRAPYKYVNIDVTSTPVTLHTVALGDSSTNYLTPSRNGSGNKLTYDIDALVNDGSIIPQPIRTISFTPTDIMKMSGKYIIRDWNMNTITRFPISEGSSFYIQTYADYSGIYTIITNNTRLMTIPEGKIPYSGSGWDEYKAYDMTADRQAMDNAIRYAERERFNTAVGGIGEGIVSGAISGALVGGPIGAGVGVITGGISSIATTLGANTEYQIEAGKIRDDQELKELRAKMSIGTGYNVSYGLIYITLTADDDNLVIGPELPLNDADALLTAYVDRVGYPCEGSHTITVGNGYYQGYIPASVGSGMYFNELNRVFRQGFKFVTP